MSENFNNFNNYDNYDNFDYIGKNLDVINEKINKAVSDRDNKDNKENKYNNGKVRLLAATKTVGADKINFAVSRGVDLIGENKVNELLEKYDKIKKSNENLEIHFIGTLQTNKVKYIIDKVNLIQSVNSIRLAEEINKRAFQKNIKMDILVEINIGGEESKTGINPKETLGFINSLKFFENLNVKGLMTIPPPAEKPENSKIIDFFDEMYKIFIDISSKKTDNIDMRILSMGMSDDFEDAISRGANIVRIGTAIFGERY